MNKIFTIILTASFALGVMSCQEKKNNDTIITQKPVVQQKKGTQSMQSYENTSEKEWINGKYKIVTSRKPDNTLPLAQDGQGQKYYDNVISVTVSRADGSVFFDRKFTKDDFRQFLTDDFSKNGALLGIVFDKIDGNNLVFGASVGNPDIMSDEYLPLVLTVSNFGQVSIKKDTTLDTSSEGVDYDDTESAAANDL